MKKTLFAMLAYAVAFSAIAVDSETMLSVKHITVEGSEIALPKTQKADGTVCQAYVAEAHREGDKLVARIEKSCLPPTVASAAQVGDAAYKITTPSTPAFTPVKAWNDGKFTFIALTRDYHGDLPVVFALAEDGSRARVNFHWDQKKSRFVVQRVLDRAILVLGDKSVVVSRT